jgi:hypothetical protein
MAAGSGSLLPWAGSPAVWQSLAHCSTVADCSWFGVDGMPEDADLVEAVGAPSSSQRLPRTKMKVSSQVPDHELLRD